MKNGPGILKLLAFPDFCYLLFGMVFCLVKRISIMHESEKLLIFLCSGSARAGSKKLSYRIASRLEIMGVADIGNLRNLSQQHSSPTHLQSRMLFINDCRSGCVRVLTHGFANMKFAFFDVSLYAQVADFDIDGYIHSEIVPELEAKWGITLPLGNSISE